MSLDSNCTDDEDNNVKFYYPSFATPKYAYALVMNVSLPNLSRESYRTYHARRHTASRQQLTEEIAPMIQERVFSVKLRCRRAQAALSFYDNNIEEANENVASKWTIVRQRLPDILALSKTYKPSSVRGQLVFLISLMNLRTMNRIVQDESFDVHHSRTNLNQLALNNIVLYSGGRRRVIKLKRITLERMIHVDIEGLNFSIPARQFIIAIGQGYAHQTASQYCPPAITDMLINLSKSKIVEEGQLYRRARIKMRIGQAMFILLFGFIIAMMCALIIAATSATVQFRTLNQTLPHYVSKFSQRKGRW